MFVAFYCWVVWYSKKYIFGLCPLFLVHSFSKIPGISRVMSVFCMLVRCPDSFKRGAACQKNQDYRVGRFSPTPREGRGAWDRITNVQWFNQQCLHDGASIKIPKLRSSESFQFGEHTKVLGGILAIVYEYEDQLFHFCKKKPLELW